MREADGLVLSPCNLTPTDRQQAPALYKALTMAQNLLREGQSVAQAKAAVTTLFADRPGFRLEYTEIANADTLQPVTEVLAPGQTALCITAYLGHVRLIDNLVF